MSVSLRSKKSKKCMKCPKYFEFFDEKCYYISESRGTWNEAKENCLKLGSKLLVVKTKAKIDFLGEMFLRFNIKNYYWVKIKLK